MNKSILTLFSIAALCSSTAYAAWAPQESLDSGIDCENWNLTHPDNQMVCDKSGGGGSSGSGSSGSGSLTPEPTLPDVEDSGSSGSSTSSTFDCDTTPSCDSLGYTKSQSDCLGQEAIRCPFNISAYYCIDK